MTPTGCRLTRSLIGGSALEGCGSLRSEVWLMQWFDRVEPSPVPSLLLVQPKEQPRTSAYLSPSRCDVLLLMK